MQYKSILTYKSDPDTVFQGINVDDELKSCIIKTIQRRLAPQPVKVRADLEVTCFHYDGIDAIKAALKAGESLSSADSSISVSICVVLYISAEWYKCAP